MDISVLLDRQGIPLDPTQMEGASMMGVDPMTQEPSTEMAEWWVALDAMVNDMMPAFQKAPMTEQLNIISTLLSAIQQADQWPMQ